MFLDFRSQLMRDEMKRLLVHRAIFDGVDGAGVIPGPILQPALEHVDDCRLTTTDRSHQQKNALAYFETLCGRLEVLDNSGDGLFNAKQLVGKEIVGEYFVLSAFVQPLNARGMNHVVDASV